MNILYIILGGIIGATFADIDLAPVLPLKHRSAWTHGPLVPAMLTLLISHYPAARWLALGFLPPYALHLLRDMFPRRWRGSARINLYPARLTLTAPLSFAWLGVSVLYALQIFISLL